MRRTLRLATGLGALLLPALALGAWSFATARSPDVVQLTLPERIGPWTALREESLSDDAIELVEPDDYVMRLYEAPGRAPIWLYAALYGGRSGYGKGAHDPEVCYPAQGWEIVGSREVDVPLGEAGSLRARELALQQAGQESAVLYWFQPAGRWPVAAALEELLRLYDAVTGRPQYAFVRISGRTAAGPESAAQLADFARALAPAIRTEVETLY